MKRNLILTVLAVLLIGGAIAFAQGFYGVLFFGAMEGYQEVPAVSTIGNAEFRAEMSPYGDRVNWSLTYLALEGQITQSHIHFGQKSVNGGIVVFLCSNLGNGPAGTQACPNPPATISGSFSAADVGAGAAAQGIGAGQYAELIKAMQAGKTYANIHSTTWPGGEIRSQIMMQTKQTFFQEPGQFKSEGHEGH